MTLHLDLSPSVEAGLLAQAQACGLSLEEYVSEVLKQRSAEQPTDKPPQQPRSLLDLFAPLRGLDLEFPRNPSTGRPVDL